MMGGGGGYSGEGPGNFFGTAMGGPGESRGGDRW
jgi:hypothetical protein